MKLAQLRLDAFGPFTDRVLNFDGPSNLHLVFGPNEAGKSSALRAMLDLRFEIPTRSTDDFVHPHKQMRVSGVFVDAEHRRVGLSRRKGRGDTLSAFDLATGQLLDTPVAAAVKLALTGGLTRDAFEAMYGIDHQRMRSGGQQLLQGKGELGAAMFEASIGSRSIATLLKSLDDEARQVFNPDARARRGVINEAVQQHKLSREVWRKATMRPTEWQSLQRAHEQALQALRDAQQRMLSLRRDAQRLQELRTVAPLLRDLDQVAADLADLPPSPDLPEDAREQRLAALQQQQSAQAAALEAEQALQQADQALSELQTQPAWLAQADSIEQLAAALPSARQDLAAAQRLVAQAERIQHKLVAQWRLVDGAGEVVAAIEALGALSGRWHGDAGLAGGLSAQSAAACDHPSRAQTWLDALPTAAQQQALLADVERALQAQQVCAGLQQQMDQLVAQRQQLVALQEGAGVADVADVSEGQQQSDAGALASDPGAGLGGAPGHQPPSATAVEPAMEHAVAAAVDQALALGDLDQRLASLTEQLDLAAAHVRQAQDELGVSSLDALAAVQPLLDSELQTAHDDWTRSVQTLAQIERDLYAQQRHQLDLRAQLDAVLAEGDVVSEVSLRQARAHRDQLWQTIRAQGFEGLQGSQGSQGLLRLHEPDVPILPFEQALADADRQADRLHADAKRAARYAQLQLAWQSGEAVLQTMLARQQQVQADRERWLQQWRASLLRHRCWPAQHAATESLAAGDEVGEPYGGPSGGSVDEAVVDAQAAGAVLGNGASLAALPQPQHVREWLERRRALLDAVAQQAPQRRQAAQMVAERTQAVQRLQAALLRVGAVSTADASADALAPWLARAQAWLQQKAAHRQADSQRRQALASVDAQIHRLAQQLQQSGAERAHADTALASWRQALRMSAQAGALAIKAQLDALRAVQLTSDELAELIQQRTVHEQRLADYQARATQLLGVLQDDVCMADGLRAELDLPALETRLNLARHQVAQARLAEQQQASLLQARRHALHSQHTAQLAIAHSAQVIARLCSAAGGCTAQQLPELEALAERRQKLLSQQMQLQRQIREASDRDMASLRASLAQAMAQAEAAGQLDTFALQTQADACHGEIDALEQQLAGLHQRETAARLALEQVDGSDDAAQAREAMESAAATVRSQLLPWAQLRVAHALLGQALQRYREHAQAPMVAAASTYFGVMTGGRFPRLVVDADGGVDLAEGTAARSTETPTLLAERDDGVQISLAQMSEGTGDQLYLALRLAALELRQQSHPMMPLVLDDVLMTSDDARTIQILHALQRFAQHTQVIVLTHHQHVTELAQSALGDAVAVHALGA